MYEFALSYSCSCLMEAYAAEREALLDIPNVYNYQVFFENDRGGYIVRQWLEGSLYDRIRCVSMANCGGLRHDCPS